MKILIADDERGIVSLIQTVVLKEGYTADLAYDGTKALELIKKNAYDLVFLDLEMPGLTGIELFSYIKEKCYPTKTIIISGYSDIDSSLTEALGVEKFLAKPFEPDEITSLVRKYDQNKRL